MYIFDLLVQSTAGTPSRGNCDLFWYMPLPCSLDLWQSTTDSEWSKHYQEEVTRGNKATTQTLTLRHLLLLRQAKMLEQEIDFAEELGSWCSDADDLSTLLWLALTVEGDGQTSIHR